MKVIFLKPVTAWLNKPGSLPKLKYSKFIKRLFGYKKPARNLFNERFNQFTDQHQWNGARYLSLKELKNKANEPD